MTTFESVTSLLDWLLADPSHIVTAASFLAALIPTPDPRTAWGKVYRLIDLLALNVLRAKETGLPAATTPLVPTPPTPASPGAVAAAMSMAILAAGLSACAQTPQGTVFDIRAAYDAAVLVPAANYASLPACPQASGQACADPSAVAQLRKADTAAKAALDAAEDVVRQNPTLDASAAISAAENAVTAVQTILATYNIQ
jgi:hypothetical protein